MTRKIRRTWHRKTAALAATMMAMSFGGLAYAMPQGETIRSGHGEITRQDKEMTVNQDTKHLAIDWKGFDINNDERVRFNQPDAASIALNRVTGDAKTFIDGSLTANGQVFVINPNGVLFGQNASVDVGSLVASTARVSDSQMEAFGNGDGTLNLALADDSTAKVINEGTIRAEGGLVALHASVVANDGTIENKGGQIALAAAKNISLAADTAGKLNFTVDGTLAKASTLNSGVLKADGGYLVMTAKQAGDVMSTVVNNTGTIEAKTLHQNEKGEILLDGGDTGIVEVDGTINASGVEAGQSAGSIKAIGAETHVKDGANLLAKGNVDGGLIETSGDYLEISDKANIDAAGETGKAGEWLLDPLDVIISDTNPGGTEATDDDGTYNESQTADANKTSWVNSQTVNTLLNNGTSVTVQAVDKNKAAAITVNSEILKSGGKDTSLTLQAQNNITVNKSIKSTSGKLNVNLHSDTDGDGVGAVLINADINTNGGNFTSGSGGNVEVTVKTDRWGRVISSSVNGKANPTKGTVGTYFGNGGTTDDRTINTNGGAVNLYGDVAIGLNGGNLQLNTNSGAVQVTGTIDSGNAYKIYSIGGDGWADMVEAYYNLSTTTKYTVREWTWNGWKYQRVTRNLAYSELNSEQKKELSKSLANDWTAAKTLAASGTGANTGDTYLATITTALENSLVSQGKENPLFVGGRGSGNKNDPVDSTYRDGYYWVTGPEGSANGGTGTKFAENSGKALENYYANWNSSKSSLTGNTEMEPNNSGPYVSVGFGTASKWDDVSQDAGTTKGFVQEENLAHSGLVINSNGGNVDLRGNVGHSAALKNLTIENAGNVNIGGGTSASGSTFSGIVNVDNNVDITGKKVDVGDRVTAGTGHVNMTADGNLTIHGITARDKIHLTSTSDDGAITLSTHGTNNGLLQTDSTASDAVIIDARGANGSFHNATDATKAKKAITTGTNGNWKVYSASPDRDTFSTNLNSNTTARWHASSQGGNGLDAYAEAEDTNKYIFQTQPTLTVTADNKEKTYGETVELTAQKKAEFIGKDGNPHDVTGYTDAFQEVSEGGSIMDRYSGSYELSSAGQAASATRTNGDRQADDGESAIYDINVDTHSLQGLEGYAVGTPKKGELTINRRTVVLNGSASQTYGDDTLKDKNVYAETGTEGQGLVFEDKLDTSGVEYTISDSGAYAASKNAHTNGVTADADTYNDELLFSNVHFTNNADANYAVTGNGDITVDRHTITRNELGLAGSPLYTTVYGTRKPLGTATFHGFNGDGSYELEITGTNALTGNESGKVTNDVGSNYYTTVKLSDALSDNYKFDNGETSKAFENTASVTPAKLTIESKDINATYGEVEAVQKELQDFVTITGLTNGDGADTMIVDGTSDALFTTEKGETRTNDVKKNGEDGYDIKASIPETLANIINKDNKNYEITENLGKVLLQKRTARLSTDDIHTTYGDGDTIYNRLAENNLLHLDNLASWDTESDILKQIRAKTTVKGNVSAFKLNADGTIATDSEGHRYTNDVRAYSITTSWFGSQNYNVEKVLNKNKSSGNIYVDKADLVVNVGNAETVYGTPFVESAYDYAYSTETGKSLVNGDTKESLARTLSEAGLKKIGYDNEAARDGKNDQWTAPVSKVGKGYYLTFNQDTKNAFKNGLQNYNISFEDGNAKVTEAELKLTTDDIVTEYGTIKQANTKVEGLTNGDKMPDAGFIFNYGNYGGAYDLASNKTNDVKHGADDTFEAYDPFETTIRPESQPEFLKNYNIISNEATATIMPKDVTFVVTGTGKTTSDVTYTENPLVDSQLVYGEHANTVYALDQDLGNNQYSILTYIDRQKVTTGDVIGNYRFNYEGLATITPDEPNPPTKPDIDHNNPSNIDGTASWTNSMGNHGVPGVDRVAGLASAELPFFKVQNGEVSHYGTYSVAADPDKVTLEATGKRLPEPNQPKTQYREYTKELTTAAGTGTFRMIYDGSTFRIKPVGMMAKNVIVSGDATQNVELYAKALHIGFNEMGILLEDLDGVYVHFDENE